MHQLILFLYKTDYSETEDRFLIIGMSIEKGICIVSHCYRDVDESVLIYFKDIAEKTELPYQILINLYLKDCVAYERSF